MYIPSAFYGCVCVYGWERGGISSSLVFLCSSCVWVARGETEEEEEEQRRREG